MSPATISIGVVLAGGGGVPVSPPPPPPPPGGNNKLLSPSFYGYPDSTNCLIVPVGSLTPFAGNFTTTSDGQVIDRLKITGTLNVVHQNVQVTNTWVLNGGGARTVHDETSSTGRWSASHCRFEGTNPTSPECAYVTRADFDWCEFIGGQDNTKPFRNFVRYHNCYMHDPLHPTGAHSDVIQLLSGGFEAIHCTLVAYTGAPIGSWLPSGKTLGGPNNSVLQIGSALTGDVSSALIDDCLCDGGNYLVQQLQGNWTGGHTVAGPLIIRNSRMGRDERYGLYNGLSSVSQWTNNVFDDDGTPAMTSGVIF